MSTEPVTSTARLPVKAAVKDAVGEALDRGWRVEWVMPARRLLRLTAPDGYRLTVPTTNVRASRVESMLSVIRRH